MNVQQFFVRALFLFFIHLKCFLVTSIDYKNTVFHHKADKRLSYASSVHDSRSAKDCVASCAVVANCLYVSYSFASAQCELSDKKPDNTTVTLDVVSGWDVYVKDSCDFGWYPYKDSCYYLVQEPTDWETAKKACESSGAHLIDIQTEDEYRFITEHITAGALHRHDCSIQEIIPILLIVNAVAWHFFVWSSLCLAYCKQDFDQFLALYCFVWLLLKTGILVSASVFVYGTWSVVKSKSYVPCSGYEPPPNCTQGTCDDDLLTMAFAACTIDWVLLGPVIVCLCIGLCYKVHKIGDGIEYGIEFE